WCHGGGDATWIAGIRPVVPPDGNLLAAREYPGRRSRSCCAPLRLPPHARTRHLRVGSCGSSRLSFVAIDRSPRKERCATYCRGEDADGGRVAPRVGPLVAPVASDREAKDDGEGYEPEDGQAGKEGRAPGLGGPRDLCAERRRALLGAGHTMGSRLPAQGIIMPGLPTRASASSSMTD